MLAYGIPIPAVMTLAPMITSTTHAWKWERRLYWHLDRKGMQLTHHMLPTSMHLCMEVGNM